MPKGYGFHRDVANGDLEVVVNGTTVKSFTTTGETTTGTIAATGAITSSSATAASGYTTGAGDAVTQQTNKQTGVTISKPCGKITMNNEALAGAAETTFIVTNTLVAATDVVAVSISASGATAGAYTVTADEVAAGTFNITLGNHTAGSLSEAVIVNFVVIKAVAA